jgi:hypothetical protein
VFAGADGVVSDVGGVCQTDNAETAHLQGVWGEPGGWGAFWGCPSGSRCVLCHFSAAACGLERGRVGDSTVVDKHVDGDVAVVLHVSGCSTGDRGTGWGEWGAIGGGTGHCWGWWGL